MPRQRHFNPNKRAQLIALVANGRALKDAARLTGCSVRTVQRESLRDPDFRQDLCRAELDARNQPLQHIRKAAASHWRAAAWLLERTDPARFGRRTPNSYPLADVENALTTLLEAALAEVYDDESRRRVYKRLSDVSRSILARLAATPTGPARKASAPPPMAPFVSQQQLHDEIEEASHFFNFNSTPESPTPPACGLAPHPPFSRDPIGERAAPPNDSPPSPHDARPTTPPDLYRAALAVLGLEPDPSPYHAPDIYPPMSPPGSALTDWASLTSSNGRHSDPPGDVSQQPLLLTLIQKIREKLDEKRRHEAAKRRESSPENEACDNSTIPAPSCKHEGSSHRNNPRRC
jgi:hypothetical protein